MAATSRKKKKNENLTPSQGYDSDEGKAYAPGCRTSCTPSALRPTALATARDVTFSRREAWLVSSHYTAAPPRLTQFGILLRMISNPTTKETQQGPHLRLPPGVGQCSPQLRGGRDLSGAAAPWPAKAPILIKQKAARSDGSATAVQPHALRGNARRHTGSCFGVAHVES